MVKIIKEQYKFQNIYIITTYKCNWNCDFCLFKYNDEKDAPIEKIIDRLIYSINNSNKKVYIKITGGEPFLKLKLLKTIFEICNTYKDKIYRIGIGSNGSIEIPEFFNQISIPTHIFLSRHSMEYDSYLSPATLSKYITNSNIDFRVNCNLIRGGIDNLEKIQKYIYNMSKFGIHNYCFRELSKVSIDKNMMYPKQIYKYIKYYEENLISIKYIEECIKHNKSFSKTRENGNYYDNNSWYNYYLDGQCFNIKFRSIDETKLIKFNDLHKDIIDEYVIHPDGTLTGCWDKERKIIMKGGDNNA